MQIDREKLIAAQQSAECYPFDDRAMIDAILAEIEAQGFVIVPHDPSEAMKDAGLRVKRPKPVGYGQMMMVWYAMIDAERGEG